MDISELPIAFLYVIYISIYVWVMRTFSDVSAFPRFIAPVLAGMGSLYIIWGAIQKDMFVTFLIITALVAVVGMVLKRRRAA